MATVDDAHVVDVGLVIDGGAGVFSAPGLPTTEIPDAPDGSIYLRTNGELYKRISGSWVLQTTSSADVDQQTIASTSGAQTTSASWVDLPGATLTTMAGASRKYLIVFHGSAQSSTGSKNIHVRIMVNGVAIPASQIYVRHLNGNQALAIGTTASQQIGPGQIVKVQWQIVSGATATMQNGVLAMIGVG